MLTDSHCHLASHRFTREELPDVLTRAGAADVTRMVTLATSLEDLEAHLACAEDPAVHACVGIHPCDVHRAPDDAVEKIAEWTADPRVCGIGETGLDYYHPAPEGWAEGDYRGRQRAFLEQHFQLAAASSLNLVIHTRDVKGVESFEDAFRIYQKYCHQVRAVFHCFLGSWEQARRVIDLGGLVSFGGVATFKSARQVRETLTACPPGSFMLETDSPYLAPEPFRGQRNEPAFVRQVAERVALERRESLEDLAAHTTRTAQGFFRFRPSPVE